MRILFFSTLFIVSGVLVCAADAAEKGHVLLQGTVPGSLKKRWMRAEAAVPKVEALLQKIRATLPKGWSVAYEKENSCLEITRDDPVLGNVLLPNLPPPDLEGSRSKMETYSFVFRVVDFVTPAHYQIWVKENSRVEKEARLIWDDFKKRRLLKKGERLAPKTDEDRVAAKRYEELIESKHDLPDFYFQQISMQWLRNSPPPAERGWSGRLYVSDDSTREECERVRENVVKLLAKYEEP